MECIYIKIFSKEQIGLRRLVFYTQMSCVGQPDSEMIFASLTHTYR